MTKNIFDLKLTIPDVRDYDRYGREHGRRQAGRHGRKAVDESSHLIHQHAAGRAKWKWYGLLKPHSWSQMTHPL